MATQLTKTHTFLDLRTREQRPKKHPTHTPSTLLTRSIGSTGTAVRRHGNNSNSNSLRDPGKELHQRSEGSYQTRIKASCTLVKRPSSKGHPKVAKGYTSEEKEPEFQESKGP